MQSDSVSLTFPRSTWSPGTRVSAVHSLSEDRQLIGCFFSEPLRFLPDGKHRAKLLFLLQTGVEFPGRGGCVQTPRLCTRAWFSVPPRSVCPCAREADALLSPGLHGTARHLCHSSGLHPPLLLLRPPCPQAGPGPKEARQGSPILWTQRQDSRKKGIPLGRAGPWEREGARGRGGQTPWRDPLGDPGLGSTRPGRVSISLLVLST